MGAKSFGKRRLGCASADRRVRRCRSPVIVVVNYKEHLKGEERVDDFVVAVVHPDVGFLFGGEGG